MVCFFVAACGESDADIARRRLTSDHLPRVRAVIEEDAVKHRAALAEAAERLAPGFVLEDEAARETQLRAALRALQQPPRGIAGFFASPMTFLAAIDTSGVVIARDASPDPMRGQQWSERLPIVAGALEGRAADAVVELPAEGAEAPIVWLFTHPVSHEGATVGAVALGIPLWSLGKRIHEQMKVEMHQELQSGAVVWTYFYHGDRLLHRGTPPDLDKVVPSVADRRAVLAKSPDGYDGELTLLGRAYGYVVAPIPALGEDAGVIIIRGEP